MMQFRRTLLLFIIGLVAIASMMVAPQPAQAGTVTTCSWSAFLTEVLTGTVDFNIGADCVINFAGTIGSSSVTIQNTSGYKVTFDGGGVYQIASIPVGRVFTISNITIQNGYSSAHGGAIQANGTLNASNMVFDNNVAVGGGGAVASLVGRVNISSSTFTNNRAATGGAVATVAGSDILNLFNNTFSNNTATGNGGAIYALAGSTNNLDRMSFTGNSAVNGGAIYVAGGAVNFNIRNNTFSQNTATTSGGGVFSSHTGTTTLTHNTFYANTAPTGQNHTISAGTVNARANIYYNGTCSNSATLNDSGGNIAFGSVGCPGANIDPGLGAYSGGVHIPTNTAIEYATPCAIGVDRQNTVRPVGPGCTAGSYETFLVVPQTRTIEFTSGSGSANEASGIGNVLRVTTSDSAVTASAITVTATVTVGTANASDYSLTGTITIPAGTAHNSLVSIASGVVVTDDNTYENDDTLTVQISAPTNASLGAQTSYTHTILNDEVARVRIDPLVPALAINEFIGTHNSRFMLTITGTAGAAPLSSDLSVDFTVMPVEFGVGPNDALEPEDFTIPTLIGYNFPVGSLDGATVNVPVTIVNDSFNEQNEFFDVKLASVTNAILPPDIDITYRNRQTLQITDNDTATYNINVAGMGNVTEPNTTTSFTISLDAQPSGVGTVILDFGTTDATECSVSPTSFTFNNGNWNAAQTITVTAVDDLLVDGTQPCGVSISKNASSTAAEFAATPNPANLAVNVLDNDAPATINIFSGNPQSAQVNTAFGAPLVVEVLNGSGDPVEGASVTFIAPGAGASALIVGSPATTDNTGLASVNATANTVAGLYTVTVTSGAAPSVNFNLTNTVGALASIAFVQEPGNTVAGVNIAPAVTVQAVDGFGNAISGQAITLNLSSGTGVLSGTLTQATNAGGIATFADLNINLIGTKQLTANAGPFTDVSANFDISASSTVGSVAFVQEPSNAVAGANIAPAVTVQVLDGFGNPMSGQTVVMTLTTGTGTLFGTISQATNASGIATFADLNINLAGTKQLTATSGAQNDVSANFDITASSTVGSVAFVQEPTNTAVNANITPAVTVLVLDGFGNPISGAPVSMVLFTGTGVLSGSNFLPTNASGIATFADLNINLMGTKQLSAISGAQSDVSVNFDILAGAPTNIYFSQEPSNTVAGANITPNVNVWVVDAFGNGVPAQSVTLNLSSGTGVLSGTLTQTTNAGGVAAFPGLSINLIGTKQLTATSGALSVISATFDITASSVVGSVAFVQEPTNAVAGTNIAPAVTVLVSDGFGNPMSGQTVVMTLTTGTGVLSGTISQATNASGIATFPDLNINLVGTKQLTATSGAQADVSANFNITAGAPTAVAFIQEPSNTMAGVNIAPAVTVAVLDAFGNGVSGQNVTLNLSSGTGVLSGTLTQATNAGGIATFADLNINLIGTKQLTATSGALTDVSVTFDITASSTVGSVTFVQEPTNAVAGVNITPAVTVQVLDVFGNPMSGQPVTISLSSGTGVLSGMLTQNTIGIGVAFFPDLNINLVGTKQLTATSGAQTDVSVNFDITAGAPTAVAFIQEPSNTVAGANITPAVTVAVLDAFGNGVPAQNITLNLSSGTGVLSGTLTQATNAGGIATFADLNINLIGTKQLTATSGALTDVSANFDITASSTVGSVAFVQEPTNAVAGVNIAPAVTVQVLDGFGNPITGATVVMTLTTGTGTLSGTISQATNASGIATFADLNINLTGTKQLTATSGAQADVSANFDITAGAPSAVAFIQEPSNTVAGANITPAVTVAVLDAFGNGVSGQSITLNLSSGTGVLSGTLTQATNAGGIATFADLNINLIGTKQLTATLGALTDVSANFDITASSTIGSVTIIQEPTDTVAGTNITPAVTVQVLDGFGNPITGQAVAIALTTGTGTLSGTLSQATDGTGTATFADLNINLIGAKQLTASAGALSDVSVSFNIIAGTGSNLSLVSGDPQQIAINSAFPSPLVVRITDSLGNPVAGETVIFTANVGGAGQSAVLTVPAVTDVNGEASVNATANGNLGAYTVDATYGVQTVSFNLTNLDPNVLTVGVACVGQNLVVTIASGSGNFDITGTLGAGLPQLNVPLGAYTFFGPDTWLNLTVTELSGDLEVLAIGNVSCDATSGGGTGTTSAPPPLDPSALGCVVTDDVDIFNAPDNTYCRILMRDGGVVGYSGAVPQNLVDLGVQLAVDVYRLQGGQSVRDFPDYTRICLSGAGRMFFMDNRDTPRLAIEMTTEQLDNMTCVWIPAPGTIILTN